MNGFPEILTPNQVGRLSKVLDDALALLAGHATAKELPQTAVDVSPSLFDQCVELCQQVAEKQQKQSLRTIHHLACTGGTLITKCVAALPNVFVLNEVDPLSTMAFRADKPPFTPTDILSLVRQSNQKISDSLLIDLFKNSLELLHFRLTATGKRLVLRDHSQSHFLSGSEIPTRPTLLKIVGDIFITRSVVTVRDPVDSFLALTSNDWAFFTPFTFDEYCRRYLAFLGAYSHLPCVRYEDFVAQPDEVLKRVCVDLDLAYSGRFLDTFDVFHFSGDSGRTSATIERRARRPYGESFEQQAGYSESYRNLASRLGYKNIAL